jgi:hypothetical protein
MKSILALSFAVLMFAAVSEKASATAGAGCAAAPFGDEMRKIS